MPRLKGSADLLEDRRKRALALLDSGESLNEVGRRIGCNPSSVMRWRDARRRGGAKALRVRFSPGRPLKLDLRQRRRLVNLLTATISVCDQPSRNCGQGVSGIVDPQ